LVLIFDNFVSFKLSNVAVRDYQAVGGFFDASHGRADNTSFEGGKKGGAPTSERYTFGMRTSAPAQPVHSEPIRNSDIKSRAPEEFRCSQSEIRNQQTPRPAGADDESAAKQLFKLSRDVILSVDRTGNILCINQRGVELSGYSESELRGANIFELLLLPEDREIAREIIVDLQAGKARQYQVR
jgi:PAS domain-containing protein